MRPRADEVLSSVAATIREHVAPEISTAFGKSLLRTIDYLLQQTTLRILHEGEALHANVVELRSALSSVAAFARTRGEMGAVADAVEVALTIEDRPADAYPTVASLTDEHARLRQVLDDALVTLLERRHDLVGDAAYEAVREQIRTCLRSQLEREARWILTGDFEQRR